MQKRKVDIDIGIFPEKIRNLFCNAEVYDSSCRSDATVYYMDTGYYVKVGAAESLAKEAKLGRLFYKRGLGVEVVDYVTVDRDYLVTRSAVGEDLTHYLENPEKLCKLLADALRNLHSQPIEGIPASFGFQHYMESAGGDMNGGCYDDHVLTDRYLIHSKREAWEIMQTGKHLLKADTWIHGDACLPNIIQNNGSFSAFIDFNLSGVGDKHTDLYWALWSLQYNLKTEAYADCFLDQYGRDRFDEDMLRVIAAFELFG